MAERGGFEGLDSCVHCGFCLQACPTFLATGDEADGPRGRIELMRALERGELPATDPDLALHLDRCLGCRGCEPVCPSGVAYGHGLEAARERLAQARPLPWVARLALWALTSAEAAAPTYVLARLLRATGLPALLAGASQVRFSMGMLAATRPHPKEDGVTAATTDGSAACLFRGCVMEGLFSHVHAATIRTLAANGRPVRDVSGQRCCGALHAHAGLRAEARDLARANIAAFGEGDDPIVVNSAGCGAMLKDYGHLLADDPACAAEARRFSARVRDVTELLAETGPIPGGALDLRVAYDPPCHLLHAQRVSEPALALFRAIPVLQLVPVAGAEQCCGSAGLFTLSQPAMSRTVLAPKVERLREASPDVVATGNPGCAMQIGAGLRAAGVTTAVRHPVELLDASYRTARLYA